MTKPLRNRLAKRPILPALVVRVALIFLPAVAVGTIAHELGHWVVARLGGCAPVLHFAWVTPSCPPGLQPALRHLGVAGGPVSSMLTGTLGMVLLHRWRVHSSTLDVAGMVYTVLALFWARPLFNLLVQLLSVGLGLATMDDLRHSDEARLSLYLGLPALSLGLVSAALALGVCVWTARCVPVRTRSSWFIGAAIGALSGFVIWMTALGPLVLP